MSSDQDSPTRSELEKLPKTFVRFARRFPELASAHQTAGLAASGGPLDQKTQHLIKIGICLGAGLESAMRSHTRRAIQAGATEAELEQAVVLGMTTCGFPRTVAAWAWIHEQLQRDCDESDASKGGEE